MLTHHKSAAIYVGAIALISLAGLAFVYAAPPVSMRTDRQGVPHFTPPVINPETGETIDMGDLIKHYRGD